MSPEGRRGKGTRGISTSSSPAAGTRRCSNPVAVPRTSSSAAGRRRCNSSATASSGLTCPAVPPPASSTVGRGVSGSVRSTRPIYSFVPRGQGFFGSRLGAGETQNHANGQHRHYQRTAARGNEWEGNTNNRQQANHAPDIDDHLAQEPGENPPGRDLHEWVGVAADDAGHAAAEDGE